MILHQIQIHCSADAKPDEIQHYSWKHGDDPKHLQIVIRELINYIGKDTQLRSTAIALSPDNNNPIAK